MLYFQVDESSDELPLVYEPATISAYWQRRPRAVATRIVQLLSVAGGFLSRIAWDIVKNKIKEVLPWISSCQKSIFAAHCHLKPSDVSMWP